MQVKGMALYIFREGGMKKRITLLVETVPRVPWGCRENAGSTLTPHSRKWNVYRHEESIRKKD
jgi:hypothetical protein